MTHGLSQERDQKRKGKNIVWVHLMTLLPFSFWRKDSTHLFWHEPWKLDPRHKIYFLDVQQGNLQDTQSKDQIGWERGLYMHFKEQIKMM